MGDVLVAVKHSSLWGTLSIQWKTTFVILIPKVDNLTFRKNYRLISLWNFSYKLITKILISRMEKLFLKLVSEEGAFVFGRSI